MLLIDQEATMGRTSLHPICEVAPRVDAAERWRNTVETNLSVFGRLVYLGSLLDPRSGAFVHDGLEMRYGKQRARELIHDICAKSLEIWRGYDREQQDEEIRIYFSSLGTDEPVISRSAGV
jgi:hypothetical protein